MLRCTITSHIMSKEASCIQLHDPDGEAWTILVIDHLTETQLCCLEMHVHSCCKQRAGLGDFNSRLNETENMLVQLNLTCASKSTDLIHFQSECGQLPACEWSKSSCFTSSVSPPAASSHPVQSTAHADPAMCVMSQATQAPLLHLLRPHADLRRCMQP